MFNYTPIRMGLILIYFLLCTACGAPAETPQEEPAADDGTLAGDVNFIGGGTAAPEMPADDEPYHSPTLSSGPPPETLTRAPSIEQATRILGNNNRLKIMVWFYGDECFDCREFERDVLADKDVIAASKDWIYVFVDVDINADRAEYYLTGGSPPAFMAMDAGGNVYRKRFGIVTKEEYLAILLDWR